MLPEMATTLQAREAKLIIRALCNAEPFEMTNATKSDC